MPEGIFANLAVAIPLGCFMLLLFAYFRTAVPIFYHRNILCHGRAVYGIKVDKNFFSWFKGLMGITDDMLMRLSGFDAVITSNGFRLILIIACIMALPCLLILAPYYYMHSDRSETVDFNTFTISDLYTDLFWPPLFVLIFLTALILYAVYAFYANFLKLRQAYLLRPSGMSSTGDLIKVTELLGSIKYARKRLDLSTSTVLVYPIPSDMGSTSEQLKGSLEKSGVSDIKSVQFIGNYGKVNEILEKRNSSLMKLEGALKKVCDKLQKSDKGKEKDNKNSTEESDKKSTNESDKNSTKESDKNSTEKSDEKFTVKERSDLLQKLITDVSFCSSIRPRHKTSKPASKNPDPIDSEGTVDSLRHYYNKLMEREEELQEAIKEFNRPEEATANVPVTPEDPDINEDFEKRYIEETTFISWKKVTDFSDNLETASSLVSSRAALIHFTDYRSASRAHQLLLTSRVNSIVACMAPNPKDLNWSCVKWTENQRWIGTLKSNIYYWALLIFFAPFSAMVVAFVDLEAVGKWSTFIENFRQNHPQIREVLQSVIAPFLATLLVKHTGKWIMQIMAMRGPSSRTELVMRAQRAHIFFLFMQTIFIGALFSNIYNLTESTLVKTGQGTFLGHFRENVPKKAHFFFNFTIQDIFNELMLELLNPKSLFLDRSFLFKSGRKDKNIRALYKHDNNPPALGVALTWSRFIIFPYFIFMVYAVISPLNVLPTMAYFTIGYVVFRCRFAEFGRNSLETGGLIWCQCAQQMIYGLILAQLSVLLQYTQFRKGILPGAIIIILFSISIIYIPFLKRYFRRSCETLSILEDESKVSKRAAQCLINEQNKMIPAAVECLDDSEIIKNNLIQPKIVDSSTVSDDKPVFDPYWSLIPLKKTQNSSSVEDQSTTFDQYQVDSLVDTEYIAKQYEHPAILEHYQVVIVPSELPALLRKAAENQEN